MLRFSLVKRFPTKPLLGLALLTLALMAAGGGAAQTADAQTAPMGNILVTFDSISFPKLNDCSWLESNCNTADLYGKVTAVSNGGSSGGRLLAVDYWGGESGWEDTACGMSLMSISMRQ